MTTVEPQLACARATVSDRVASFDWHRIGAELDEFGYGVLRNALTAGECASLAQLYPQDEPVPQQGDDGAARVRARRVQILRIPLPALVAELRTSLYERLAPIADRWNEMMGVDVQYPAAHDDFIERCHRAGQTKPTPLLLQYGPDDYNCLHQDLYGEHVFPLQAVFLLSAPDAEFTGGELVLTEQRPRMQSRVEVVPLTKGDGAIFAVHQRPLRGSRGYYRVTMRHGASRIRSGRRYTAGVIFHDAK
jgi:hypothetical protein